MKEHEVLSQYTTLQVGGPARYFVAVKSEGELEQALRFAKQTAAPVLVLGEGSNILISDAGYDGLVIKNEIHGRTYRDSEGKIALSVGAGEVWDDVVAETCERGLWGFENLSAIPGTVGATPIQNVGAYGVEVSSLITEVAAMHVDTLERKIFSNAECQFRYRDSFFKSDDGRKWIVTNVTFTLEAESKPNLSYGDLEKLRSQSNLSPEQIRNEIIHIRSQKFPDWHIVGTAGSFFKNPIIPKAQAEKLKEQYPEIPVYPVDDTHCKVSLGWILDKLCGLKGFQEGEVGLYKNQALVLVNTGTSASAVIEFAKKIQEIVKEKTDIDIEPEVRFV